MSRGVALWYNPKAEISKITYINFFFFLNESMYFIFFFKIIIVICCLLPLIGVNAESAKSFLFCQFKLFILIKILESDFGKLFVKYIFTIWKSTVSSSKQHLK